MIWKKETILKESQRERTELKEEMMNQGYKFCHAIRNKRGKQEYKIAKMENGIRTEVTITHI